MDSNGSEGSRKVRRQVIERLRAGEQPFLAWGYSLLKRKEAHTESDGTIVEEEFELAVPIKSIGVAETMERIARKAPVPPITKQFIKVDSDEGRALGLKIPRIVEVENTADASYKEQLLAHGRWAMYNMILTGLAMDVEDLDENRNPVLVVKSNDNRSATQILNEDKAITILKAQGLSNEQFEQLYEDIKSLTSREKERIDQE
jgi:hypothetical protein